MSGYREASLAGPESALKYVTRTLDGQGSLPNAVKFFAYDLVAEASAELELWQRCADGVLAGLVHLSAAEADLPAELRERRPTLALWDRGILARMELGDFPGALELCDDAIARGLGNHFEAKRDSLEWAR